MKRFYYLVVSLLLITTSLATLISTHQSAQAASGSDFRPGRIIDDAIFTDKNAMSVGDVQNFLNGKVPICDTWGTGGPYRGYPTKADYGTANGNPPPYTCLKEFNENSKSSAQIIWEQAQTFTINPKDLIVLLQKEQGLVTDDWPWQSQYRTATGYGCPDSTPGVCDSAYYGFTNQVYNAARMFRKILDADPNWYSPYLPGNNTILWNPNSGCGSSQVYIENRATAALYNYTPYRPNDAALNNMYGTGNDCSSYGNRNFWRDFTDWFGTTLTDRCNYNAQVPASTNQLFHKYEPHVDYADFTIYTGTSTNCIESHIWNPGMQSWYTHIASVQPVVNYPDVQLLYGDLDGGGRDYPILFGVRNTSTGQVESHVMNRDMKSFLAHAASNQPAIDPADCKIVLADLAGSGKDQVILVCERNTGSGFIELHGWNPGMQTWAWHTITNMPAVDPSRNTVLAGDLNGDGKDELILAAYAITGSSKVEFHVWNPGQWSWRDHIATNMPEINVSNAKVEIADIDGNGVDEAILVAFKSTGSGKIEFHIWNPGFTSWRDHIASNQPAP